MVDLAAKERKERKRGTRERTHAWQYPGHPGSPRTECDGYLGGKRHDGHGPPLQKRVRRLPIPMTLDEVGNSQQVQGHPNAPAVCGPP